MIKIINGVFGYNNGKSIIPKTNKDEPFSCDEKTEKRLVSLGIAVYVGTGKAEQTENEGDDEEKSLYTDATNFAELKEIAKNLGATDEELKPLKSKAQVRELIDQLANEEVLEEGDDEDAPNFDEVDGVEG